MEAMAAVACQGYIHDTGWYFLQCQSGSVVFQADPAGVPEVCTTGLHQQLLDHVLTVQ